MQGLLQRDPSGALRAVATAHARVPFGLPDDVDVGADGTVYFTDASSKFRIHHDREDILEHGGHGRLLAYHPSTGRTELLLSGLQFANGVAVSGDGTYVLVNETGAYGSCGTGSRAPGAAPRRSSRTTFPGSRTT